MKLVLKEISLLTPYSLHVDTVATGIPEAIRVVTSLVCEILAISRQG